ncbi:alpha/beta fold hydrolase [Streptomyces sp. NPDC006283]|uniref:thioesterase II family protein n=1 Tax=Streptomyces sp. NPDC006283 TaxID=3156741 RepID=UPI0033A975B1
MNTRPAGPWYRCPAPRPAARLRLLCFPHGGGTAAAYRHWPALLPDGVELHAAQYPGHADRITEPLHSDLHTLADQAADAARPLTHGPYALYGHSLGALVAHETALRLQAAGHPPLRLVVSGMPAPHLVRPGAVHRAGDSALIAELRRLEGFPDELLAHPDMVDIVLRTARADYALAETYRPRPQALLHTPITVHRATEDPELTAAEAAGWRSATTGPVREQTFPGGHFHLAQDPAPVLLDLTCDLVSAASGRWQQPPPAWTGTTTRLPSPNTGRPGDRHDFIPLVNEGDAYGSRSGVSASPPTAPA